MEEEQIKEKNADDNDLEIAIKWSMYNNQKGQLRRAPLKGWEGSRTCRTAVKRRDRRRKLNLDKNRNDHKGDRR